MSPLPYQRRKAEPVPYEQAQMVQHLTTIIEPWPWLPTPEERGSFDRTVSWTIDRNVGSFCVVRQIGERRLLPRNMRVVGSFMLHRTPDRTMQYMFSPERLVSARHLDDGTAESAIPALYDFVRTGDPMVTHDNQDEILQLLAHAASNLEDIASVPRA